MEFKEITNEKLTEIVAMLKTHVPNWPKDIASKLSADKAWKEGVGGKCAVNTVYNISAGLIASQFRRRLFVKTASVLLLNAAQENNKTMDEINAILK